MNMLRSGFYCCVMLALLGASAPAVRVPQADIDAENARWQAFGVTLPAGGIVQPMPYQPPYSNRSFVVPYSWLHASHDSANAAALRSDLPTLQLLVQKTYAGYARASQRHWNWNSWFRSWDTELARAGNAALPVQKAFAPWIALEHFQYDAQSGPVDKTLVNGGSASALLASAPSGSCDALRMSDGRVRTIFPKDPGQQPHAVQAWNGRSFSRAWYVSYPQLGETARSIRCGRREIALTAIPAATGLGAASTYETLAPGIAYVRIPSFSEAADEALRKALSGAQGLGKEQVVILDLRGNTGGVPPLDLMTTWFSGGMLEEAAAPPQRIGTQSCFNTALQFNSNSVALASLKPPVNPDVKQRIQRVLDTIGTTPPDACTVKPDVGPTPDGTTHAFSVNRTSTDVTRLVVIVDSNCKNDCEAVARLLSRLPDSVLVGESTYGALGFAEPGYFVLPHSRIAFKLASSRIDPYGDGRSLDGYGFTIDVLLPNAAAQQRSSLLALAQALAR